jgi:hypothetical protein
MLSFITPRRARRAATVIAAAAVAFLSAGCMLFARAPQDLDYARTRVSEGGLYRGTIRPQGDSIPQGRLHSWTLHLETAAGQPVDVAAITVDGGMPQHGHGLPTKPRVATAAANGDHLVQGLKFNMGGWWVVTFHVRSPAGADSLVFNLKL